MLLTFSLTKEIFHIILSTLTFSAICLSAIQAGVLAIQDRNLRKYHRGFTQLLPPIESMENFLFKTIAIGFVLLTSLLVSSVLLFSEIFSNPLIDKFILSFCVWIVLAILLSGRLCFGWRGSTVIRWTFLATSLIVLIYFGSFLGRVIN
jgi:ABC-type uncharacterized transport system permease subunit